MDFVDWLLELPFVGFSVFLWVFVVTALLIFVIATSGLGLVFMMVLAIYASDDTVIPQEAVFYQDGVELPFSEGCLFVAKYVGHKGVVSSKWDCPMKLRYQLKGEVFEFVSNNGDEGRCVSSRQLMFMGTTVTCKIE